MTKQTNRYALFCGEYYYPIGGIHDLAGTYPSAKAAIAAFRNSRLAKDSVDFWFHVIDLIDLSIVARGGRDHEQDIDN